MKNAEIAKLLYDMADLLEIKGVAWKPNALRKAAKTIESMADDIQEIYNKLGIAGLVQIQGVGEGIAKKIEEFLKTGDIKDIDELKKSIPEGVNQLMRIPSIGPRKAWRLYKELKITSLEKLEMAAKAGKIRKMEGFGEKSEREILDKIDRLKKSGQERRLLGEALPYANIIVGKLRKLVYVKRAEIAGSLRRKKETIGDIDILVTSSKPTAVIDYFTKMDEVKEVTAKGSTRSAAILKNGMNCDLRCVDDKSYGAALLYFTGNKEHNIAMRLQAIKKGWKLSEYGLFDKKARMIAGKTEEEVYNMLGLPYFQPEIRENTGEFEMFSTGNKPELIDYDAIKGDLHVHTIWSDGHYSTEVMVKEAIRMGYEYVAITDHSKSSRIASGLDEKRLLKHLEEIEKVAGKYKEICVLKGSEVDILKDGKLDYSDEFLAKLDFVIASVHSNFKMEKAEMTKRIIKAIENKHVNAIGHLTGRLINTREPYEVEVDKILDAAKERNVAMEINSFPSRLDLRDFNIRKAVDNGNKIVINTDSHDISHFKYMEYGISQARRGWATKNDVVNSWPLQRFKKFISR